MLTLEKIYHAAFVLKNVAMKDRSHPGDKTVRRVRNSHPKTGKSSEETGSFQAAGSVFRQSAGAVSLGGGKNSTWHHRLPAPGNHAQGVAMAADTQRHDVHRWSACRITAPGISNGGGHETAGGRGLCLSQGVGDDGRTLEALQPAERNGSYLYPALG